MQIKTKFFIRLFILAFIPFLILSLLSVYLFNRVIEQVISPGFEKSLTNSEYMVENSLELYRLRFFNLVDILAEDSITSDDLKYFDLIMFISAEDTMWLQPLSEPDHNRIFIEEATQRISSFPEIISFEGKILVYQKIVLNPSLIESPLLIVGQYLPEVFSNKAAEIISAKTEYSRLKTFVMNSGSRIVWLIWMSVAAIFFTAILYISIWWANSLVRPINNLSLTAFEIAKGKWGKKVTYGKKDELGTLVSSFNYMSSELKTSTDKLIRAEMEASWKILPA